MAQTIDRGTLDRLIALGRARGALTPGDLHAALPVERMEVDDLVLVMLELDAAGIDVDPDAFGPPSERAIAAPHLPPAASGMAPPVTPAPAAAPALAPPDARAPGGAPRPLQGAADERAEVNRAVAMAGLATLLVLGAVLLWP